MVGRRTVPTLTVAAILGAMAIVGCIEHTITGPGGSSGAEFAAHLIAQSGNSQLGAVSQALPLPVTVKVTDNGGLAVAGATVTFSVRLGGGSVSTSSTVSGATGVASTVWTMGPQLGPQQLIAFLNGTIVLDSTVFNATATNGPAAQIIIDAGNTQRGTVGTALGTLVSAKVTDLSGNPVPNAPVTWTVVSGGGQIVATRQTTDSTGRSFATWTLGTTGGSQTVSAALASGVSVGFRATAAAGAPVQLIQVAGSGQTGTVGLALTTPLSVRVVDSYGNGVAGAAVSFSADQGSILAGANVTDSLGGMLGRWTLGQQTGLQSSVASLSGTAPVTFVATGRANGANTAAIETGNNQTQTVRQMLPLPLVVRVTDKYGNPVAGTAVTWAINQGGGTLLATFATTDSSGRATAIWTLGSTTGSQLATLSVPSLPLVVFSATATPGAADTLAIVAGNNQSGTVSTALGTPLIVRVVDASGNPEVGVSVIFAVASGGGTVNPAIATTDASGRATANWTIGSFAGAQTATATSGAKSVTFVATGAAAGGGGGGGGVLTPAQIVLVSGNGQSGNVSAQLGQPMVVKVVDASGIPVSGTTVTWTIAAGNAGGSASPNSSVTDGSGQASTIWTLGSKLFQQTLTASVAVPALSQALTATGTLGSSGAVLINGGNNQTGPTGSLLPSRLLAKVVDQNNNAVVGARVTWTIATGGGSLTQTAGAGITNALGVDSASWTLGSTVGSQTVTAAVSGVGSITFSATATTVGGTAASIRIISGSGQVGRSQQVLPNHLVVEVRDASGNTLSGISVTFTQDPVKNPAGFTSPSPVTTGADGQASVSWTLGNNNLNTTVPMAVWASTAGLAAIDTFTATARPEYRIVRGRTPFLQVDTTGATIGAPGDYLAGVRDTLIVQVYDPTDSSGVQGISVTWATQAGDADGHPNNATTVTDNFGFAKTTWVLRSAAGLPIQPSNIAKRMFATATMGQVEFQASVTPGAGLTPAQIVLVSGNGQAGNVGTQLGQTVQVKVVDANGTLVSGTTVTWTMAPGNVGGVVSPVSSLTDGSGQASTIWQLGDKVGLQTLTASVAVPALSLPLIATANLGSLDAVLVNSGNNQTNATGALLASKLIAKVVDQNNNPVVGARVTWAVATGGGSLTQTPNVGGITNAAGLDTATWTLGSTVGAQTVTAAVAGVGSITFTATATTVGGTAATIRIISGNGQVGRSAQVLPLPLVVEVRDASGNTLSGISVTFTQDPVMNPAGFTSPTPVTTGATGQASVTWTLGSNVTNTTVPMAVYASPVGVAVVDTFTATARPEYRIQRVTTPFLQVDTTNATIGAPGDYLAGVRDTLRVFVYDPTNNTGVQGIPVTWATQTGAPDGHPVNASSVTDNFGFAKTLWVLRTDAGAGVVPANSAKRMFATATNPSSGAVVGQVEFQASVAPGRTCSVSQNTISSSPAVGTSLADTVTVLDCNGFPVPGAGVTFTPGAGSGSATPNSVFTNSAGQAFTTWTLGTSTAFAVQSLAATVTSQPTDPYVMAGPFPASTRAVSVVAGAASSVAIVGSPPATAPHSSPVTITVIVKDAFGNVVAGQVVSFAASGGGATPGAVSTASSTTSSGGTVSVVWTMGSDVAAVNTLTITAGGALVTVSITGT